MNAHRLPLLVLVAVALLSSVPAQAATSTVLVKNDFFAPRTVTVHAGDKVKWAWRSAGHAHDVTSRSFADSGMRFGGSFVLSFRRTGRFPYVCTLHRGMTGTVVVRR